MTSYFLLVKKKIGRKGTKKEEKAGVESGSSCRRRCGFTSFISSLPVAGCKRVARFLPSGLFPGFIFFLRELLGGSGRRRSLRDGARRWKPESKSAAKSAPPG